MYLPGFVAEVFHDSEVAREGCRVAGDVDNAAGLHISEVFQDGRRTARARGIDDNDIGAYALPIERRHDGGRVTDDKLGVFDAVVARIFPRVEDGGADDLNAVDVPRPLCEEECDRPRAAVGVDDGLRAVEVGVLQRLLIEDCRLCGIDLEEGARRDVKAELSKCVSDGRLPP